MAHRSKVKCNVQTYCIYHTTACMQTLFPTDSTSTWEISRLTLHTLYVTTSPQSLCNLRSKKDTLLSSLFSTCNCKVPAIASEGENKCSNLHDGICLSPVLHLAWLWLTPHDLHQSQHGKTEFLVEKLIARLERFHYERSGVMQPANILHACVVWV